MLFELSISVVLGAACAVAFFVMVWLLTNEPKDPK
jgi:hypothetical protein